MINNNNNNNQEFFEAVAAHNLERFHSETIAWIFNNFPNTAKHFIMKIHNGIDDFKKIHKYIKDFTKIEDQIQFEGKFCWAEENQIDILLKYSYDSKNYQIIIENKIKASEHQIGIENLKIKDIDELNEKKIFTVEEITFIENKIASFKKEKNSNAKSKLSQSEFYYFREKLNRAQEIIDFEWKKDRFKQDYFLILKKYMKDDAVKSGDKKTKKKDYVDYLNGKIAPDYCRYVFLKPSKIYEVTYYDELKNYELFYSNKIEYNFEQLNSWSSEIKNPWITLNYKDLKEIFEESGCIPKDNEAIKTKILNSYDSKTLQNEIIAKGYLNFIDINLEKYIDLDDFNKNKYGKYDYFKLLMKLVKSTIEPSFLDSDSNKSNENTVYEYIEAGSSNGDLPLFAFYKTIEKENSCNFFTTKEKKQINDSVNVGIQVQGNNFKYYVAAVNYDNTIVKKIRDENNKDVDTEKYKVFVKEQLLGKITKDVKIYRDNSKKLFNDDNVGFHSNRTKTFYSRSYKIEGFIKDEKSEDFKQRNIFDIATEIAEKVNEFIAFPLNEIN